MKTVGQRRTEAILVPGVLTAPQWSWGVRVVSGPRQPSQAGQADGGELADTLHPFDRPLVVGTGERANLILQDPSVSRIHACFTPDGDGVEVTDLGSRNGTFIGRGKVLRARVGPDTEVRLGRTLLRMEVLGRPENALPRGQGELSALCAQLAELPYKEARAVLLEGFEREYAKTLLDRAGGNISRAARLGGLDRVYLHRLLRKYSLSA